jgi:hypothetical protein
MFQVTRIPVAGPEPYNTLACCTGIGFVGFSGTVGNVTRGSGTAYTGFVLQGVDHRVRPNFLHSTAAWIRGIGPGKDDTWLYAVDSIDDAGFDPFSGNFYVTASWGLDFPHQPSWVDAKQLELCITSYVLVYEPPVVAPPPDG